MAKPIHVLTVRPIYFIPASLPNWGNALASKFTGFEGFFASRHIFVNLEYWPF